MGAVKDIDRGWGRIKRELRRLDGGYTKTGIQQGTLHKGTPKDKEVSDMVIIAATNEFGTKDGRVPSRPAFRQAYDGNQGKISRVKEELKSRIYTGALNADKALGLLGEFMVGLQKKQITKLKSPPNAPSTVGKKRSTNPLIDTGQLRGSVTHVEVMR